jgi:hypothetical protein
MRSLLVLLEDVVQTEFGAGELVKVRATAADRMRITKREPTMNARLLSMVEAMALIRRKSIDEMLTFLGLKVVPLVFKEMTPLLRSHTSTRPLLLQISRLAPAVLEGLTPGVEYPEFDCEMIETDTLRVGFEGSAEMAAVFEGVAMGIAQYFGERVQVKRTDSPAHNPRRMLVDVRVVPERRGSAGSAPGGVERRRFFSS